MAGGTLGADFFYCQLCPGAESGPSTRSERSVCDYGFRHDILVSRGVYGFLADIEEARNYRIEGGIIGACLAELSRDAEIVSLAVMWANGENDSDEPDRFYRSAREYRERYILEALKGSAGG